MKCVPAGVGGDDSGDEACANCGTTASDTVKLKNCTACRLVKYCGVDCQRAHRKQHKKECKQRVAELKDEQLYSQGLERMEGDFCPICSLPIPVPMAEHAGFSACCMKRICNGCLFAAQKRGITDCPFCRTPCPDDDADGLVMMQKRVAKKDPEAIFFLGEKCFHGKFGVQKDMRRVVKLWTEAAELGSIDALFELGNVHYFGEGVKKDEKMAIHFWSKAAMQGHVTSRYQLGIIEGTHGNYDSEVKHLLISSKMGDKNSLERIKTLFTRGDATEEDFSKALKGYRDAMEETKSKDRDEAKRLLDNAVQRKGVA